MADSGPLVFLHAYPRNAATCSDHDGQAGSARLKARPDAFRLIRKAVDSSVMQTSPDEPAHPGSAPPLSEQVQSVDRRSAERRSGFDRRRGPGRRRTDYRRAAEEGCMNEEQSDFIQAVDEYKRVNRRPFPSWTEILDIVLYLGYRRVAPVGEFGLTKPRQTPLPKRPALPENSE
jgi:hypothetical protein